MTTKAPNSDFDAIAMKRRAARRIHERLREKGQAERLDYWNERTESLRRKLAKQDSAP